MEKREPLPGRYVQQGHTPSMVIHPAWQDAPTRCRVHSGSLRVKHNCKDFQQKA